MAFKRQGQQRVSKVASVPAYTKGINDYDPVAMMDGGFALSMLNFFPSTRGLVSRQGYRKYASGFATNPKSFLAYRAEDGSEEFFACTDDGIYNISASTIAPVKVATLTNGYTVYTHFANAAGTWIVVVNGTDLPWIYNGVEWTQMSLTAPITKIGEVEGVDPSTFSFVLSYKNRLWFVQKDSTTLWYLPTDQLGGVATPFYVGAVLDRGGYVVSIWDWTFGDSSSLNDRLAIISSTGQVATYSGTDPSSASTWGIDGLFYVSSPFGPKSVAPIGGDLAILTKAGIIPLSATATDETRSNLLDNKISKYINRALNGLTKVIPSSVKWALLNVPNLQALLVVVPDLERPIQFVMNLVTGAWTIYDLPIVSVGIYSDTLYFSAPNGTVYRFGTGHLDGQTEDGLGGVPVQCSVFSAFNYFDSPGVNKTFKLARPILQSANSPSISYKINVDFDSLPLPGTPPNPGPSGVQYLWDIALWDEAFWSAESTTHLGWHGVAGVGMCCAYLLKVAAVSETTFVATEFVYEESNSL